MADRPSAGAPPALPPGPKTPAAWQLLHYTAAPISFLEGAARKYGDTFTIRLAGYGDIVILSDPEAVREVFRGDPAVLHSGKGNAFLATTVGPTSVLVLDDEPHARQRQLLLPPLKGERMRSYFAAMQAETLAAAQRWPIGQPVRTEPSMRTITSRVIAQAVLGLPPGDRLDLFERQTQRLLDAGRGRFGLIWIKLLPIERLQRVRWMPYFREMRALDASIHSFVAHQRTVSAEQRGENIVADLLSASHADGSPLSAGEIRDAVLTLLMAGYDTTSTALSWALTEIVPRRDVIERLQLELQQTTGGQLPRPEHLDKLSYLDACIRETLRLRTILPFVVRMTQKPIVIRGREYPAGVMLAPCNHLVHRRPDLYPDPERFRPERFLERKFSAHEWFPFGGGHRMCLGMAFAMYEMKVVLSTLLVQLRLERPAGARSRPVRRGLTLNPHDRAVITIVERRTLL